MELRGGSRGVLAVEWWAEVVVVWVRLGTEMEVISEEFGVLVCSGTKGKEMPIFSEEEGRILGSLRLGEHTGRGWRSGQ